MADNRFNPRANSIGFMRFALASAVVYWHCVQLGGVGVDPVAELTGGLYYLGALGVDGFFALSGYLIVASYLRLRSVPAFAWHRARRIFPGYWVCLLVCAFGLPLLFGLRPDPGYFVRNSLEPATYVTHAAGEVVGAVGLGEHRSPAADLAVTRGQDGIPGLFESNPSAGTVNGSLWSLRHEVRLYVLVGLVGGLGLLSRRTAVVLLAVTWVLYVEMVRRFGTLSACAAPRTSAHFLMGVVFYYWDPPLRARYALAAVGVGGLGLAAGWYPLVGPLCLPYVVFWLAAVLPLRSFGKRDYSYGIYIYSFPVQQSLAAAGVAGYGFAAYLAASFAVTVAFAAASWHLVERPAMRWRWPAGRARRGSGQDGVNHLPADARQPLVQAGVEVGQLFVVQAHQVQDGRVQVRDVGLPLDRVEA
jgi:peptidoglycan/LPS O-acetylase OafA/YrhL